MVGENETMKQYVFHQTTETRTLNRNNETKPCFTQPSETLKLGMFHQTPRNKLSFETMKQ
jgi:hypothetical protein